MTQYFKDVLDRTIWRERESVAGYEILRKSGQWDTLYPSFEGWRHLAKMTEQEAQAAADAFCGHAVDLSRR